MMRDTIKESLLIGLLVVVCLFAGGWFTNQHNKQTSPPCDKVCCVEEPVEIVPWTALPRPNAPTFVCEGDCKWCIGDVKQHTCWVDTVKVCLHSVGNIYEITDSMRAAHPKDHGDYADCIYCPHKAGE